jgi:hypothetical protein
MCEPPLSRDDRSRAGLSLEKSGGATTGATGFIRNWLSIAFRTNIEDRSAERIAEGALPFFSGQTGVARRFKNRTYRETAFTAVSLLFSSRINHPRSWSRRTSSSRKHLSSTAFCEPLHISVASRELSFRKSSLAADLARRYSFSETGNLFVRHLFGFALGYHSY